MPEGLLPPVIAELRGNVSDLQSKLGTARQEISQTVEHGSSRFGALSNVSRQTWSEIGGAATVAGGAMIAISDKLETAHVRLETAVKNSGAEFDEFKGRIDGADRRMESLGFTFDQTETALGTLTTVTGDTQTALDQMGNVADIARYKHIQLGQAADLVAKLFMGQSRAAKQLGVDVDLTALKHAQGADKIRLFGDVMEQVHVKIGGQAAAYTHTLGGELDHLKAVVTDFVESHGKAFGTVLSGAGMAIFGMAQIAPIARAAVSGLGSAFSGMIGSLTGTDTALKSIGMTEAEVATESQALGASLMADVIGPLSLLAIATAGAVMWENNLKNSGDQAAQALIKQASTGSDGITKLKADLRSLEETFHHQDTSLNPFTYVKADKTEAEIKRVKAAIKELEAQQKTANAVFQSSDVVLTGFGRSLSVSGDQAHAWADELNIDMTKGQPALDQLGKKVEETQGKLSSAFSRMGVNGDAWANAFLSQTHGGIKDAENLATSVDKVATAYMGLTPAATTAAQQLGAMGAQGKLTADQLGDIATEAKQMRDGMASSFTSATSVVQAFGNGFDPTKGSAASQIMKFFKDSVAQAKTWAADLKTLAAQGLDQGLLGELAQAGPKAEPLLQGLLADVKAGNLGQINQTQTDLRNLLGQAQGNMLSYATPFFVAGQTLGTAGANGVGGGMGGAIAQARNAAIAAAAAMNEASQFFANAGANNIAAYNRALAAGASPAQALLAGEVSHLPQRGRFASGFAAGGIVDRPTLAWVGEKSHREVIIPMDDPGRAQELASQSGLLSLLSGASGGSVGPIGSPSVVAGGGPIVINVYPSAGMDEAKLATKVRDVLRDFGRNNQNGSPVVG